MHPEQQDHLDRLATTAVAVFDAIREKLDHIDASRRADVASRLAAALLSDEGTVEYLSQEE